MLVPSAYMLPSASIGDDTRCAWHVHQWLVAQVEQSARHHSDAAAATSRRRPWRVKGGLGPEPARERSQRLCREQGGRGRARPRPPRAARSRGGRPSKSSAPDAARNQGLAVPGQRGAAHIASITDAHRSKTATLTRPRSCWVLAGREHRSQDRVALRCHTSYLLFALHASSEGEKLVDEAWISPCFLAVQPTFACGTTVRKPVANCSPRHRSTSDGSALPRASLLAHGASYVSTHQRCKLSPGGTPRSIGPVPWAMLSIQDGPSARRVKATPDIMPGPSVPDGVSHRRWLSQVDEATTVITPLPILNNHFTINKQHETTEFTNFLADWTWEVNTNVTSFEAIFSHDINDLEGSRCKVIQTHWHDDQACAAFQFLEDISYVPADAVG
eukprot:scaffold236_cov419-Prasinococcus_capsulatus_cf.AAC.42